MFCVFINMNIPYITKSKKGFALGEIYACPDSKFDVSILPLDFIEMGYERIEEDVSDRDDKQSKYKCQVYVATEGLKIYCGPFKHLADGDYKKAIKESRDI